MKPILAEGYAYGLLRRDVSALKENRALNRQWQREREERICKVAREHPDMQIDLLAERFGCADSAIQAILIKHRIRRERDMLATLHRNGQIGVAGQPKAFSRGGAWQMPEKLTVEGKRRRQLR